MAEPTQRELDLVATASFIKWMNDAFNTSSTDKTLRNNVREFSNAYARIIKSYEEEIEWLKSALNAGSTTQTDSSPALAGSAVAQLSDGEAK